MENHIVELDVRPILKEKREPFAQIMEAVKSLKPTDIFVLHATFNPVPLLAVMKAKGYTSDVKEVEVEHFVVTFTKRGE